MYFRHSPEIWEDHPALVPGVLLAEGVTDRPSVDARVAEYQAIARQRLERASEGDWPEVQAWRRVFAQMGLKPTQYRCAAESLLRRFRKEGALPRLHPLVDLCNAVSLAFAIPIAVFDVSRISQQMIVRYAKGDERYHSFAGEVECPDPREVVFADADNRAHARRWTHRQSAYSAVRGETASVLIVAEAHHQSAPTDVIRLVDALADELKGLWAAPSAKAVLSRASPSIEM